jgi:hypothetical protein
MLFIGLRVRWLERNGAQDVDLIEKTSFFHRLRRRTLPIAQFGQRRPGTNAREAACCCAS